MGYHPEILGGDRQAEVVMGHLEGAAEDLHEGKIEDLAEVEAGEVVECLQGEEEVDQCLQWVVEVDQVQ